MLPSSTAPTMTLRTIEQCTMLDADVHNRGRGKAKFGQKRTRGGVGKQVLFGMSVYKQPLTVLV